MKAVICTKYGSSEVLHQIKMEKPIPMDNEVLAAHSYVEEGHKKGSVIITIGN